MYLEESPVNLFSASEAVHIEAEQKNSPNQESRRNSQRFQHQSPQRDESNSSQVQEKFRSTDGFWPKFRAAFERWYIARYKTPLEDKDEDLSVMVVEILWKPNRISPAYIFYADVFYGCLLALLLAYIIYHIYTTLQGRKSPSTAVDIQVDVQTFRMPFLSLCFQSTVNIVESLWFYDPIKNSEYSSPVLTFTANYSKYTDLLCLQIYNETQDVYAADAVTVYIEPNGSVFQWTLLFATSYDPIAEGGTFDLSGTVFTWNWVADYNSYTLSKRIYKKMSTSNNLLTTSFTTTVTYGVTASYVKALSCTESNKYFDCSVIAMDLSADVMGVAKYTDIDPVNTGTLIGSIGGLFNYTAVVFSVVFGFAMRDKWRKLETQRMMKIAKQRSMQSKMCDIEGGYINVDDPQGTFRSMMEEHSRRKSLTSARLANLMNSEIDRRGSLSKDRSDINNGCG